MKSLPVQLLVVVLTVGLFPRPTPGGEAPDRANAVRGFEAAAARPFVGIPTDWSARHVIFSTPIDGAARARVERDPRYWLSLLRRTRGAAPESRQTIDAQSAAFASPAKPPGNQAPPRRFKGDWAEALGSSTNSQMRRSFPAKFDSGRSSCSGNGADYVVYTTANNSANQFNLIAYENLYVNNSGNGHCPGTAPTPKFVYNASQNPAEPLNGEPVMSLDGSRIAFIESQSGGAESGIRAVSSASQALFHVLLWREGDVPTAASQPFPAPYNSADGVTTPLADCASNGATAPCEYSVIYSGISASASSPYIDYGNDTAYVTDDGGHVLAIAPVFTATPANPPAIVSGWGTAAAPAVTTTGGHQLTPPVFDPGSQNVFVGDITGALFYVLTNSGSLGSCASGSPPCLGTNSLVVGSLTGSVTAAIADPPLVDVARGSVFVFSAGQPPDFPSGSFLTQASTTLASPTVAMLGAGTGANGAVVPAGAFDNAFITSANGTGLLYGCGFNSNNVPMLSAFPVKAGALNASAARAFALATAPAACSPPTETLRNR
ncbi:MAG: hypothetical protein ACREQD_00765, partial [Candidatus Binataceae bacterium]